MVRSAPRRSPRRWRSPSAPTVRSSSSTAPRRGCAPSATATVDTLAGGQRGGTVDGAGEAAGFGWPRGIAVAGDGSLLVVDAREHALRKVMLSRRHIGPLR